MSPRASLTIGRYIGVSAGPGGRSESIAVPEISAKQRLGIYCNTGTTK